MRAKPVNDRHQPIHGESAQISIADTAKVGRGNTRQIVRAAYSQALFVERLDDLRGQNGLELSDVGILSSEIAEYVPATPHDFQQFSFHPICSLIQRAMMLSYLTTLVKCDAATATSSVALYVLILAPVDRVERVLHSTRLYLADRLVNCRHRKADLRSVRSRQVIQHGFYARR